jgi:hypothetical protein
MILKVVLGVTLLGFATAQYDYADALGKSILFYEAQRSGWLPDHHRVEWRKVSALDDGQDNGLSLEGGWYDAGDHVKFNFPMASSATLLIWSLIDFHGGYEAAGEVENMYNSVAFVGEYLKKVCEHLDNNNRLYAQVGDGYADHGYWGRPEQMTMFRPSIYLENGMPGSDLAGETASALAAAAILWKDSEYGDRYAELAARVFDFAWQERGKYSDTLREHVIDFYGSTGYEDELCLSAAWLYRLTGDPMYLDRAVEMYDSGVAWSLSWDAKQAACQMLMYIVTDEPQYMTDLRGFLDSWVSGSDVQYTPGGLAWRDMWGPNRYAGNTAFLAVMAAKFGAGDEYYSWGKGQIDYMLGSNPRQSSYLIGFGNNYPKRPHHRSSSCHPDHSVPCNDADFHKDEDNPVDLVGALVGGPDQNDWYEDRRDDYVMNEVACDYNAGFQGALAGIVEYNAAK